MKKCTKCGRLKELNDFYNDMYSADGKRWECKSCTLQRTREYHQKNPKAYRKMDLAKHGLTLEAYDKMFEQQNGVCAICGLPETRKNQYGTRKLSVDHDHLTGKVRGLLCSNCNQGIGHLKSDEHGTEILCAAIGYLKNTGGKVKNGTV